MGVATDMRPALADNRLLPIPIVQTGPDFPLATLRLETARAHALLDLAAAHVPVKALKALDAVSRRWLEKWSNPHLSEIDEVARMLARPGAYFFSINYEWGCTCQVAPSPERATARLIRVLDWRTPGLGKNFIAAKVEGNDAGPFMVLTWPGYTGVLQGMAPSRFSAALNQAPMRRLTGFYYFDWAANRGRVWKMPHPTPAHLLRDVFETAKSFVEARQMLIERPISTPAIYSLAGIKPSETVVIERSETEARVHDGRNVAANHWQAHGWRGGSRGVDSAGRACLMHSVSTKFDPSFAWLKPPILNPNTRLVMIADASAGRVMAQGWEPEGPATLVLDETLH